MAKRKLHRHSAGEVVGSYAPNRFLIVLEEGAAVVTEGARGLEFDRAHAPTFEHEYWHFLQNVTTLAGFKSFALSQQYLPLFSRTLAANGSSKGSAALPDAERDDLRVLLKLHDVFEGDVGPEDDPDEVTVVQASTVEAGLMLRGRNAPSPVAKLGLLLRFGSGDERQVEMRLGSCAIEESVAALVEHEVAEALGIPLARLPEFPYRVLQHVVEYTVGPSVARRVQAALGTLALMSLHPGPALLAVTRSYKAALDSGLDPENALATVVADVVERQSGAIDVVLKQELPDIERVHGERGPVEEGIRRICGLVSDGLRARMEDMLFDIRTLDTLEVDGTQLSALHLRFPCLVIQRRAGDGDRWQRDLLVTLDGLGTKDGANGPRGPAALMSQQTHWAIHLDGQAAEFKPRPEFDRECPFYTSCDLDLRAERADDCKQHPWELSQENPTCWYGAGVLATRGKLR